MKKAFDIDRLIDEPYWEEYFHSSFYQHNHRVDFTAKEIVESLLAAESKRNLWNKNRQQSFLVSNPDFKLLKEALINFHLFRHLEEITSDSFSSSDESIVLDLIKSFVDKIHASELNLNNIYKIVRHTHVLKKNKIKMSELELRVTCSVVGN